MKACFPPPLGHQSGFKGDTSLMQSLESSLKTGKHNLFCSVWQCPAELWFWGWCHWPPVREHRVHPESWRHAPYLSLRELPGKDCKYQAGSSDKSDKNLMIFFFAFRSNRPKLYYVLRKNPGKKSSKASLSKQAKTLYMRLQKPFLFLLYLSPLLKTVLYKTVQLHWKTWIMSPVQPLNLKITDWNSLFSRVVIVPQDSKKRR